MTSLLNTNLIQIFSFYLAVMFVLSLMRRWRIYRDSSVIALSMRGRWPKLVQRMGQHRAAFLNWTTFRPLILVIILMCIQFFASWVLWPQARLPLRSLPDPAWQLIPFLLTVIPMLSVDIYFLINVKEFDRFETERSFDQAERWAGSVRARFVRVITVGLVNPDRKVDEGVQKGLADLSLSMSRSMWWVSVQMVCRLLCGLTIWLLWAFRTTS